MPYIRIAGFFLCLVLLIAFANKFLLQTDTVAFLTIREMQQREDIEMAIIGSSVVRDHFDPVLISEETGLTAFDVLIFSFFGCAQHADDQNGVIQRRNQRTRNSAQQDTGFVISQNREDRHHHR